MDYERKGGREREGERKGDGERRRFGVPCTAVTKLCSEWERGRKGKPDEKTQREERGVTCNPLIWKMWFWKSQSYKPSQNETVSAYLLIF